MCSVYRYFKGFFLRYPYFNVVVPCIFGLDQISKFIVRTHIPLGTHRIYESVVVIPNFLYWIHVKNTGAAWGIFSGYSTTLGILGILAIIGTLIFHKHFFETRTCVWQLSLGLIYGGVLGNIYDRLKYEGVTDFVDIHLPGYRWPAFNIADCGICVGVIAYITLNILKQSDTYKTRI